jgi:phospholipid/cholesterol/gamma-HCH transport system substrate-binding protein
MAIIRRTKDPRATGIAPFKAGIIAIVLIALLTFFGFTRYNPLKHPFELKAAVKSANNLEPASPVRIAGVNVGKVKKVEPIKGGGAIVTMAIEKPGLPIHKDAQLKIRPRIFLEGNFFVDIQPGTPSAPVFKSGDTVPVQSTSTPVQFGQLLTALQSDTRQDLQTLLYEYAVKGLGNGGAEAYNRSLKYAPGSLRNASIANEASLGQKPHDLSEGVIRGQQRLAKALTFNPGVLKDLVTQLNTTAAALAREDSALEASVPLLRDTLRAANPALISVDNALPSLRAFARDALPGVRSSGPTIDASLPFVRQLRLLVRPEELRGLVHDLRPTIPALARVNRGSIGLLNENRALSACQNKVLLPWVTKGIPNPEEPQIDGEPFYKQAARGLVGLAGESRISDGNSPVFHILGGSGPANRIYTHEGEQFIATVPAPPDGTRPGKPNDRPNFRPGEPCELQEVPDLNAPRGETDPYRVVDLATNPTGLLPPLPGNIGLARKGQVQLNQIKDHLERVAKGKPSVDPLVTPEIGYLKQMRKLGLEVQPNGKIRERAK